MRGNAIRFCFLSALALAVAACSSSKQAEVDPNLFPTDWKREMFATLTGMLADPTLVRDAYISDPVLRQAGTAQRYTVCVRSNSRDLNKSYTGVKDRIGYFYGGHLNQLVDATSEQCANAAYKPWPELTNYCLAKKCE
jgi:hypothetical protein